MRLLFDECLPRKLKFLFVAAGHDCETAREAGFGGMTNGELLAQAEFMFDVLVTIDRNLRYQQNFLGREIAVLVLCAQSNDISDIEPLVPDALVALKLIKAAKSSKLRSSHSRITQRQKEGEWRRTRPSQRR